MSGVHDFDFLIGRWNVRHRRLRHRGCGCSDWDELTGTAETRALLGGLCNVEEHRIDSSTASGVALRCFEKSTGLWSIYWVSERSGGLEPPVSGSFDGDEGFFKGEDVYGDRPVKVRFIWRRLTPTVARWEQAFSYDHGSTWETNWTMDFERAN
jgi:hypothetical protein